MNFIKKIIKRIFGKTKTEFRGKKYPTNFSEDFAIYRHGNDEVIFSIPYKSKMYSVILDKNVMKDALEFLNDSDDSYDANIYI